MLQTWCPAPMCGWRTVWPAGLPLCLMVSEMWLVSRTHWSGLELSHTMKLMCASCQLQQGCVDWLRVRTAVLWLTGNRQITAAPAAGQS
jgi:hypothetical protein